MGDLTGQFRQGRCQFECQMNEWKQISVHCVWGMEEPRTLPGLGPGESKSLQARLPESSTGTGQVKQEDTVPVCLLVLGKTAKTMRK